MINRIELLFYRESKSALDDVDLHRCLSVMTCELDQSQPRVTRINVSCQYSSFKYLMCGEFLLKKHYQLNIALIFVIKKLSKLRLRKLYLFAR